MKGGWEMSNEEFQSLVLKKLDSFDEFQTNVIEKLDSLENGLSEVKEELSEVKVRLDSVETGLEEVRVELSEVKVRLGSVENGLGEVKVKLDAVYDQTAFLTEFKTETEQQFVDIKETLDFVLHKEVLTEKEVYSMKMKQAQ